jgi:1-pyrroline-5-carboxylate dehydrogenase
LHEIQAFRDAMNSCPKSGLHNPLKNPERYNLYGEVFHNMSVALSDVFIILINELA